MRKKRGVSRRDFNKRNRLKERLLKQSEISLLLNHYDDIFSDFDSRPYSQRAMSDDFLTEAKRASRDKPSGGIELEFLVPKEKRNLSHEAMIKKRLNEHFRKHFEILHNEKKKMIIEGIVFMVLGIVLMFLAALVLFNYKDQNFTTNFLVVLLEPGGWFFFWEGLSLIIFEPKKVNPDLGFYKKMTKCIIRFFPY